MEKQKILLLCLIAILTNSALVSCSENEEGDSIHFRPEKTIALEKAGTLPVEIGTKDMYNIKSLKLTGPLNGTDVLFLRKMAGIDENKNQTDGILAELDLSEANIVAGGQVYCDDLITENDIIGIYMFAECSSLQKVILPNNITKIDFEAFMRCENLKYISIPETVKEIGSGAFGNCKSLMSIKLPNRVRRLHRTFENCSSLSSVELPDSLKSLSNTFMGCTSLKSITFKVYIPHLYDSFYGCTSLETVNFPQNIKDDNDFCISYAFANCTSLQSITFPEKFFKHCLEVWDTQIDWNPFLNCKNLKSIYMKSKEPPYFAHTPFPTLLRNIYSNLKHTIDVYIPRGSYAAYSAIGVFGEDFQQNDIVNFIEYDF